MRLNDFSLRVVGGQEESGGYVALSHSQTYQLVLRNDHNVRCDCEVEIDGKNIGLFRIDAHKSITLERPISDSGRFTFYELGTPEANQAGLNNDSNLGLIRCTFTPEYQSVRTKSMPQQLPIVYYRPYYNDGLTNASSPWGNSNEFHMCAYVGVGTASPTETLYINARNAGGTGLSGYSNQTFYEIEGLNYDFTKQTMIFLRLVSKRVEAVRPLTSFSTQVPPRI